MHIINVVMRCWQFFKDNDARPPREPSPQLIEEGKDEEIEEEEDEEIEEGEVTHPLLSHGAKFSNKPFNTQAFCIVMEWSVLVVGPLTLTVIAYSEMPFQTLDLISYLLNIFQIFIVIITLLITYKIFMLNEPDVHRLLRQIRKTYKAEHDKHKCTEPNGATNDKENNNDAKDEATDKATDKAKDEATDKATDKATDEAIDEAYDENVADIEATGAIAGKALETVIRRGI
jgi:hypothetical protein